MTKEEVIACININKNDPAVYTKSAFDGPYAPQDSDAFNGRTLVFRGEDKVYSFRMEDTNEVWFSENCGPEEKCYGKLRTMDSEVYLLNLTVPSFETARQVTLIADTVNGCATVCDAHIGTENCTRDVDREFIFGRIDGEYSKDAPLHSFTDELVGNAILWDYGPNFTRVKHIYISNLFYSYSMDTDDGPWMATNPADYVKVRDGLYIFSFVEERQPGVQMLLLIDTEKLHDIGCIFGVSENGMSSGCVGGRGEKMGLCSFYGLDTGKIDHSVK